MKLTIREIAKLSGVSTTTVSHILNGKGERFSQETIDKVLKVVEENQYSPNYFASNIIKNKSRLIGIIVPDITEPFAATLINLIRKPLNDEGYNLMTSESLGNLHEEMALFERYSQMSVEGILCFTSNKLSKEEIKRSCYRKIPVVFIDTGINDNHFGNIHFNEYETVVKAIEWLICHGHSKIGLITDNGKQHAFPHRAQAYYDTLKKNQIQINRNRIVETDFSIETGYKAAEKIMRDSEVTAIFCCDDNLALGCYQAVFDSGKKVNEDIEIIGFDGVDLLKHVRPKVKTLELPFEKFGDLLAKKILLAIKEPLQSQPDAYFEMIFTGGE